jgi:hypothetical protein
MFILARMPRFANLDPSERHPGRQQSEFVELHMVFLTDHAISDQQLKASY